MKFPSLVPEGVWAKTPGLRAHYYNVVLPYQLRKWYRTEVRPLFCKHKKTYVCADWSYTQRRCSNCDKVMRDLRKDPE